jgi:hypothetical protein
MIEKKRTIACLWIFSEPRGAFAAMKTIVSCEHAGAH